MLSAVHEFFKIAYDSIDGYIPFKPEWKDYRMDLSITHHKGLLKHGETSTTVDNNDCKLVIIGCDLGNIVMYEYTKRSLNSMYGCTMPYELRQLFEIKDILDSAQFRILFDPLFKTTIVDRMNTYNKAIANLTPTAV